MHTAFFVALNQTSILFILMASGLIVRKLKIVDDRFSVSLSDLIMNLLLPALIIQVMDIPFSMDMLTHGGVMILSGISVILGSALFGHFIAKLLTKNALTVDVIRLAITIPNFGFMGYPVVDALLGKGALFSLTMFSLPFYIIINTIGIYMITPNRKESKASIMSAVNPVSISILIGIILFLIPIPLPKIAQDTINLAGSTVTPLSMIMTGMILGGHKFGQMFNSQKIYLISLIRLIIIPVCVFTVFKLLGFSGVSLSIPVLISAMPVAANLAVFANQLKSDSYTAAQAVFVSTALCMLTIPLIAFLLNVLH